MWYVDDTKISHKDDKVVQDVINALENKFGVMIKSYGAEHNFWGMN